MNMDDGTIVQISICRCIGNTIFSLVIFARVVQFRVSNTTTKYIIVWLSSEFTPRNYKGNHIPSYLNMDNGTIFQYSIQSCIINTVPNLMTFSRGVSFCENNNTARYNNWLNMLGIASTELQRQSIICHCIWIWMIRLSSNIPFWGVLSTQFIV